MWICPLRKKGILRRSCVCKQKIFQIPHYQHSFHPYSNIPFLLLMIYSITTKMLQSWALIIYTNRAVINLWHYALAIFPWDYLILSLHSASSIIWQYCIVLPYNVLHGINLLHYSFCFLPHNITKMKLKILLHGRILLLILW